MINFGYKMIVLENRVATPINIEPLVKEKKHHFYPLHGTSFSILVCLIYKLLYGLGVFLIYNIELGFIF